MSVIRFVTYEVWWYGLPIWLAFIAAAYCATRYLGPFGLLASAVAVAAALYALDLNWVLDDMREHPEHGRDADGVFLVGLFLRMVLFNLLLLPASYVGLRLRRRFRHRTAPTAVA